MTPCGWLTAMDSAPTLKATSPTKLQNCSILNPGNWARSVSLVERTNVHQILNWLKKTKGKRKKSRHQDDVQKAISCLHPYDWSPNKQTRQQNLSIPEINSNLMLINSDEKECSQWKGKMCNFYSKNLTAFAAVFDKLQIFCLIFHFQETKYIYIQLVSTQCTRCNKAFNKCGFCAKAAMIYGWRNWRGGKQDRDTNLSKGDGRNYVNDHPEDQVQVELKIVVQGMKLIFEV